MADFGPDAFRTATGVSRETIARLEIYETLLRKWQPRINLVGARTLGDVWHRHFYDSAQLAPLVPDNTRTLVDVGSGAGFPGLVLAILGVAPDVHLVESDRRKAQFLIEVSRETSAPATVHCARMEAIADLEADVLTARAVAPLPTLLELTEGIRGADTLCLFLKGEKAASELTAARERWKMTADKLPSRTAPEASILRLTGITREF